MDVDRCFPGRFIKSAEFQGKDVTLTITAVALDDLPDEKGVEKERGKGKVKTKGIVSFKETPKGWVLNRTNALCLVALWGRETDGWIGKRVTLYPQAMKDTITGEDITGIRVRGSPEIAEPKQVEIRLPRKKPITMTMQPTGARKD